jgi:hypothetical protein
MIYCYVTYLKELKNKIAITLRAINTGAIDTVYNAP